MVSDRNFINSLDEVGELMVARLKDEKKILVAGNGGSAADAQHFAAELAGHFVHERKGLPVIALTTKKKGLISVGLLGRGG